MPTTIHLPPDLLEAVDHQAKDLGLSRNRYIVRALRRALEGEPQWSPQFIRELETARSGEDGREALAEMRAVLAANRLRKAPPEL